MPVTPTYPGVYIEEIPSGVRTITGVATSITAFIGRTLSGPDNEAITITSFADFERTFGGLAAGYPLSYAVRDFYLNGGSQAIIVRLFNIPQDDDDADLRASTRLVVSNLNLDARYKGSWGNKLRAVVDTNVSQEVADAMGVQLAELFNLTVSDTGPTARSEMFRNVTVVESSRRVDRVLENESRLVRYVDPDLDGGGALPAIAAGSDPVSQAEAALKTAQAALKAALAADPPVQADIDAAQAAVDDATEALADANEAVAAADSDPLEALDYFPANGQENKQGLYALEQADLFNLLCIPPDERGGDTPSAIYQEALAYCVEKRAMLIVDSPFNWGASSDIFSTPAQSLTDDIGLNGTAARNAALFFPRIVQSDPMHDGQLDTFVPCGVVAGVMARTDTQRGVWKAPAGMDAGLSGVAALQLNMTDRENGLLNPVGINCLRTFPIVGRVVWGARTLRGADQLADEYKYIPVRRLALYLEESLYRGLKWVVFEPNDEPLWASIRLNVGAFLNNLFRQGAFQGQTPREAYFVKCDKETTTQNDINLGIVNIVVGFAPLKPAEFVIVKIQQIAGQIQV